MEKFIRTNSKVVTSVLIFVALILVILLGGVYTFRKVLSLRDKINTQNTEQNTLTEKVNSLNNAQNTSLTDLAQKASTALPSKNSALFVITQLRSLATQHQLIMDTITLDAKSPQEQELSTIEVSFRLEGEYPQVSSFITDLSQVTPILSVESIKILKDSSSASLVSATLNVKSYWSPFPEALPSLNEPVLTLTDNEQNILGTISSYKAPNLEEKEAEPLNDQIRENPFSLGLF